MPRKIKLTAKYEKLFNDNHVWRVDDKTNIICFGRGETVISFTKPLIPLYIELGIIEDQLSNVRIN